MAASAATRAAPAPRISTQVLLEYPLYLDIVHTNVQCNSTLAASFFLIKRLARAGRRRPRPRSEQEKDANEQQQLEEEDEEEGARYRSRKACDDAVDMRGYQCKKLSLNKRDVHVALVGAELSLERM